MKRLLSSSMTSRSPPRGRHAFRDDAHASVVDSNLMGKRIGATGTFLASPIMLACLLSLFAAPALADDRDRTGSRAYCTNSAGESPRPGYDPCLNAMMSAEDEVIAQADTTDAVDTTDEDSAADEPAIRTEEAEPAVTVVGSAEPWEGVTVHSIGFAFDSAELTPAMKLDLDELAENLQASEGGDQLRIVGYTDNTGPADYNMQLSERRARTVADYLAAQGIEPERMTVVGHGMDEPRETNTTREGRQANRRVATASFR